MIKKTGDAEIDGQLEKLAKLVDEKGVKIQVEDPDTRPRHFLGLAQNCCN